MVFWFHTLEENASFNACSLNAEDLTQCNVLPLCKHLLKIGCCLVDTLLFFCRLAGDCRAHFSACLVNHSLHAWKLVFLINYVCPLLSIYIVVKIKTIH